MPVAIVEEYRVVPGRREAFLDAVRARFLLGERHGASATLRRTLVGGEATDVHSAVLEFTDPVERGGYLDQLATPEHLADHAPSQLADAGDAMLLGRSFVDELPSTAERRPQQSVLSNIRFRVTGGREAEADEALLQGIELRRTLGIEAHLYVAQYAGERTGLRILAICAPSHSALAADAARVVANRQRVGGLGPIPRAVAAGAMTMAESSLSTLVAL